MQALFDPVVGWLIEVHACGVGVRGVEHTGLDSDVWLLLGLPRLLNCFIDGCKRLFGGRRAQGVDSAT